MSSQQKAQDTAATVSVQATENQDSKFQDFTAGATISTISAGVKKLESAGGGVNSNAELPEHLWEAERLLELGFNLVKLHPNSKRPVGDNWNDPANKVTAIDPNATGYGIPLALNGLCSLDPDNVEIARIGMKGLGFNLEAFMAAGVRTKSTRPGSGGRVAFADPGELIWRKFQCKKFGVALELRAHSANLQDCAPGVTYMDSSSGQICQQDYANGKTFMAADEMPAVPKNLLAFWKKISNDPSEYEKAKLKFWGAVAEEYGMDLAEMGVTPEISDTKSGKLLLTRPGMTAEFNQAHSVEEFLEKHGYEWHPEIKRWSSPSSTGSPSIREIPGKTDLWQSSHQSDPLEGTFDAWSAFVILEHSGVLSDAAAAFDSERGLDDQGSPFEAVEVSPQKVPAKPSETLSDEPTAEKIHRQTRLDDLPGALGDIQAYYFGLQIYPDPDLAGFIALQIAAHFTQANFVVDNGMGCLGLHQYGVAIAPTTFGKERIIDAIHELSDALNGPFGNLPGHVSALHGSLPQSMQQIHKDLESNRSLTFMKDEFGEWLAAAAGGKNPTRQEALGYLMEAYTKATKYVQPPNSLKGDYQPVKKPRVSLLGITTGERLEDTLTEAHAESGAYNRAMFYPAEKSKLTAANKRYRGFIFEPPQRLIDWLVWLHSSHQETVIEFTDAAADRMIELDMKILEPMKHADLLMAGRLLEHAVKIAALIALADKRIVVDVPDIEMAVNLRLTIYERAKAFINGFGGISAEKTNKAYDQVVAAVMTHGKLSVARIQLHSRAFRGLNKRDQALVLNEVEKREAIRLVKAGRGQIAVSEKYLDANPLLRAQVLSAGAI